MSNFDNDFVRYKNMKPAAYKIMRFIAGGGSEGEAYAMYLKSEDSVSLSDFKRAVTSGKKDFKNQKNEVKKC